jgi:hypothetical protein
MARVADGTPAARNRVADFWRVIAIAVVVIGHWLAASIWLRPDDEIALLNSLEWIPYAAWVTLLVQVMPLFFLVGGYANALALRRVTDEGVGRTDWITTRSRRLFTPVVPLLLVWVVLIVAARPFVPERVVDAGAMSATVPLWFLAVYLTLTAAAPTTHRWWTRHGLWSVAGLTAAALVVDVCRFAFDIPGIGWLNFLFVWAVVHQLGYWWARRDRTGGISPSLGWSIAGGALAVLIAITWIGWYPVAMLGVPGLEATNMVPPTLAIALLGVVQGGIVWATRPLIERMTQRRRAWRSVVAVSGVIMTVYLWHLSAMSLIAAAGLFSFDGALFRIQPGTTAWWLTRPLWITILLIVTLGLVAVFARFEWRISDAPLPERRRVVAIGVLLCAGSAGAVAMWGLASRNAVVNWIIPAAAVAGASLLGALPKLRGVRRRRDADAGTQRATTEPR